MSYAHEFPKSVRTLRDQYHGSFVEFWKDFRSRTAFTKEGDGGLLNDWCMAACYSADDDGPTQSLDPAYASWVLVVGFIAGGLTSSGTRPACGRVAAAA
jgi:hypothetical protein